MKQERRIQQAQNLGWVVGWRTTRAAGLYYHGLRSDWIEIEVNGGRSCWVHVRKLDDGGEKVMWDSGWTRVRPRQFQPYLKRLVAGLPACQTPKPIPPHIKPLL